MWTYNVTDYNNDYLAHHGIKGQKWGVRRYQNLDGSYTKEGLRRYFSANKERISAEQDYRRLKAEGVDEIKVLDAKNKYKAAKRYEKATYNQLAKDASADKGKSLYQQGKTIESQRKYGIAGSTLGLIALGGVIVSSKLMREGQTKKAAAIVASALAISLTGNILNSIGSTNVKNLRAYYSHSRPQK